MTNPIPGAKVGPVVLLDGHVHPEGHSIAFIPRHHWNPYLSDLVARTLAPLTRHYQYPRDVYMLGYGLKQEQQQQELGEEVAAPRGEGPHGILYGVFTHQAMLKRVQEMIEGARLLGNQLRSSYDATPPPYSIKVRWRLGKATFIQQHPGTQLSGKYYHPPAVLHFSTGQLQPVFCSRINFNCKAAVQAVYRKHLIGGPATPDVGRLSQDGSYNTQSHGEGMGYTKGELKDKVATVYMVDLWEESGWQLVKMRYSMGVPKGLQGPVAGWVPKATLRSVKLVAPPAKLAFLSNQHSLDWSVEVSCQSPVSQQSSLGDRVKNLKGLLAEQWGNEGPKIRPRLVAAAREQLGLDITMVLVEGDRRAVKQVPVRQPRGTDTSPQTQAASFFVCFKSVRMWGPGVEEQEFFEIRGKCPQLSSSLLNNEWELSQQLLQQLHTTNRSICDATKQELRNSSQFANMATYAAGQDNLMLDPNT